MRTIGNWLLFAQHFGSVWIKQEHSESCGYRHSCELCVRIQQQELKMWANASMGQPTLRKRAALSFLQNTSSITEAFWCKFSRTTTPLLPLKRKRIFAQTFWAIYRVNLFHLQTWLHYFTLVLQAVLISLVNAVGKQLLQNLWANTTVQLPWFWKVFRLHLGFTRRTRREMTEALIVASADNRETALHRIKTGSFVNTRCLVRSRVGSRNVNVEILWADTTLPLPVWWRREIIQSCEKKQKKKKITKFCGCLKQTFGLNLLSWHGLPFWLLCGSPRNEHYSEGKAGPDVICFPFHCITSLRLPQHKLNQLREASLTG